MLSGHGGVFFGVEASGIDIDVRFIPFPKSAPSQDIVSPGIVATTIHPFLCITSYHLISHPIASYDHQPSQTQ